MARLLAEAVDAARQDDVDLAEALSSSVRQAGEAMAAARGNGPAAAAGAGGRAPRWRRSSTPAATSRWSRRSGAITLRNCPFHELAERHIDLVCGLNLALLEGLVAGLPTARLVARLAPAPWALLRDARSRVRYQRESAHRHPIWGSMPASCQRRSNSNGKMPVAWPSFHVIASPHVPWSRASSTRSGSGLPGRGHTASPWSRCARHVADGQPCAAGPVEAGHVAVGERDRHPLVA